MPFEPNMQGTGEIGYDKEAWDLLTYFAFKPELFFDQWATVKPTKQSTQGSTVTFTKTDYLDVADTPLDEYEDVTTVTHTDSNVSVTLKEYGNAVRRTRFLKETGFIPVDPVVAQVIGQNAGESHDTLARTTLHAGTTVNDKGYDGRLTSSDVRKERAKLRGASVPTFNGYYAASIHPDVSVDLREETGATAWRDPQVYGNSQLKIWNGEIGIYEGVRFVESPRALVEEDEYDSDSSGTGDADKYHTLFIGGQAVAKAFSTSVGPTPTTVPGPVTDTLRRFVPMGWYWLGGYAIFREESLRRIESGSSLDDTVGEPA